MGRPRHPAAGRPGAGDRARAFHRRPCRRTSCALRAQPGCLRPHRPRQRAGRRENRHRCRARRRAADPADAAQIQLSADRAAAAGQRRGALCRRADCRRYAPTAAEAEDIADGVEIEIEELPGSGRCARRARARCAARPRRVEQCRGRRPHRDHEFRRHARQGTPAHSASRCARAGRTRRRSKRAPRMRRSIRRPAASR